MEHLRKKKSVDLKRVIARYNNRAKKVLIKGVWKMTKAQVLNKLRTDFRPVRKNNHIHFKHKSGRFTHRILI